MTTKRIKLSNVINIILVLLLVTVVVFGYFFFRQVNPAEVVIAQLPAPEVPEVTYLTTIYGQEIKGMDRPFHSIVADNKVYVTDTGNSRIVVFDYNGKYLFDFGGNAEDTDSHTVNPMHLLNVGDEIFVSGPKMGVIKVFDLEGNFLRKFAEGNVAAPIAVTKYEDRFYVLDVVAQRVLVLNEAGTEILDNIGNIGSEEGQFYFPNALTFNQEGQLLVVDSNNNRIQKFSLEGEFLEVIQGTEADGTGGVSIPRGIAFDKAGNIYVAENMSHRVSILGEDGVAKFRFNYAEPKEGDQITLPNSVFIDENNRLYVTEMGSNRILVYKID